MRKPRFLAVTAVLLGFWRIDVAVGLENPVSGAAPITPELAREGFARFRALEGEWTAASTKGWTETLQYRTIAGGSAVLETSFGAHPNETMATVFQMDGDALLLTHYCVAGNAPRLVATEAADGGRTLIFKFRDGANLPTRDLGHMDAVVFTFEPSGRVRSRWTWYENGTEKWMEEIVQSRRAR